MHRQLRFLIVLISFLPFGRVNVLSFQQGNCNKFGQKTRNERNTGLPSLIWKDVLQQPTNHHHDDDTGTSSYSSTLPVSLSDRLSSPERYASALGMSVQEIVAAKETHAAASFKLHKLLSSLSPLKGHEKHALLCQHRYRHGRNPFVCRNCWSYKPICICNRTACPEQELQTRVSPPAGLDVVVWIHHDEWGRTSNTGSILGVTLDRCEILMKGLPKHDARLKERLECTESNKGAAFGYEKQEQQKQQQQQPLAVVLWPGNEKATKTDTTSQNSDGNDDIKHSIRSITVGEIQKELCGEVRRPVILIAVDGTWRNARRMVKKLPSHVARLDLTDESTLSMLSTLGSSSQSRPGGHSILAPLRQQGKSGRSGDDDKGSLLAGKVCTVEAVVAALVALGMPPQDAEHILSVAKTKIDLTVRYRGKWNAESIGSD